MSAKAKGGEKVVMQAGELVREQCEHQRVCFLGGRGGAG